jgi:hypothetical protein
MGNGYIRQSAASIVTGEDIEAAPLNAEFNALRDAFAATTGHTHDDTTGEGPKIALTTSISGVLPVANGGFAGIHKTNATVAPGVGDDTGDGYAVGSVWVDTTADKIYQAVDVTLGAAVWKELASGSFQPLDTDLTAIAALVSAANKLAYATGAGTWALTDFTAYARTILDDADEATFKATVNLEIGTDVQAFHAYLADIAAITANQGDIIYFNGTDWVDLAPGTSGHFLKTNGAGANPEWASGGGISVTGTPADNQIAVWTSASALEGTAMLTLDPTAYRLNFLAAVNDANPELILGKDGTNDYAAIEATYNSGAQTLDKVTLWSATSQGGADEGRFEFWVDEVRIVDVDDGGINFQASKGISIAGTDIITDVAGTATLSNIDALDATTEATIEAAIDTLGNLTSASALATVGTITNGTWQAGVVDITYGGTGQVTAAAAFDALKQTATVTYQGVVELATDAEAAAGTDTGRAVTPSGVAAAITGKYTIWVPASAMVSPTTSGAPSVSLELTTNDQQAVSKDFDATAEEFTQFFVAFPKSWNLGTVTAQVFWTHPATVTNFGTAWGFEGAARSNDDAIDAAWGTEVVVTDTGGTTSDLYVSAETGAITIGGTPADDDLCWFRITRVVGNAGDTMAVDAKLLGVKLFYTTDLMNDD